MKTRAKVALVIFGLTAIALIGTCTSLVFGTPGFGGDDKTASSNGQSNDGANPGNTPGTTSGKTATPKPNQGSGNTGNPTAVSNLPKIQVGTLGYGTYLTAIGATKFMADRGINIQLVDVLGQEGVQCNWIAGRPTNDPNYPQADPNVPRFLLTTHNATRLCEGVKIAMVVDQSAGVDMLVTRGEVSSYQQIFENTITVQGECSVSEYLLKSVASSFGILRNQDMKLAFTDAVDQAGEKFIKDPTVKTLATYEPYASDALAGVPGSKKFLTTANWAGIIDVGVVKATPNVDPTIQKFMAAWFDFVKLESQNFDEAWKVLDDYSKAHPTEDTFIKGVYDKDILNDELQNLVAQASFADNVQMLLKDTSALEARLAEVDRIQQELPCTREGQIPQPSSFSTKDMIDGRYIAALQNDSKIANSPTRTVSKNRLTQSTTVPLETAVGNASEVLVGQLQDLFIEFQADKTDFVNDSDARSKIERQFLPILRLSNNTVIELVGGFAAPGSQCPTICPADPVGEKLAVDRAAKVKQILVELGVDPNRVRVNPIARKPTTGLASQAGRDRRVEAKVIVVGGR